MRTTTQSIPSSFQLPFIILALVCSVMAVLLVSVSSMMSAQYDTVVNELNEVREMLTAQMVETPVPNGAMWSLGTGGFDDEPYREWLAVYPVSTLWPYPGAPSLRFTDHAQERPDFQRDFEIGFYRYGPTWYSKHFITEFWLGDGEGGILSIAGNNEGGGELQVRNPYDDDSVIVEYTTPDHPVIRTESGRPLYLSASEGLVSETHHIFEKGITVAESSEMVGVVDSGWVNDRVIVPTSAVDESSVILITPFSEPVGRWWVGEIIPGESFTVFSTAEDETMQFQWFIVDRR